MPARLAPALRTPLLPAALATLLSAGQVGAQLGDPAGPGQSVPVPPAQCPRTLGCQYAGRNSLPEGYRFQMLHVCGAIPGSRAARGPCSS